MKQAAVLQGLSGMIFIFGWAAMVVRADDTGPYFSADVGPAITEDTRLREFPGGTPGGKVRFDPGARLSLGGGYRFFDWLSAGGESGVIANELRDADGDLSQIPLMGNVEFRLPNRSPVEPYLGGGPGVAISVLTLDHDSLGGGDEVHGTTSDAVWAWQIYGGARYRLSDHMGVGVFYKYFAAGSPRFDVRRTSEDIRFGRAHTHSFGVSFSMDF